MLPKLNLNEKFKNLKIKNKNSGFVRNFNSISLLLQEAHPNCSDGRPTLL